MFSPFTGESKGGGRPIQRFTPSRDAPEPTVGPADALGQPRDPSSAVINTGGNTVPATAPADERAASAPASGLVVVINACLAYITSLLQVLTSAGGPPGQLHVFLFGKHLLELLAVNGLDVDTECLIEACPADDARAELLESIWLALSTEGASPSGIVTHLVELIKDCIIPGAPAACAAPAAAASASSEPKIPTGPSLGAAPPA